jgi:formylglycine-generating enzyme required for sulfatase activity
MKHLKFLLIAFTICVLLLSCSKTTEPDPTVAKPAFSPEGGTYTTTQTITISSTTLGVTILYTIDGSDPISSSTVYTDPILISATTTVNAKAFRDGWKDSQIASAIYIINTTPNQVATPTFDPPGGAYTSTQNVTISCATSGASIFYTTGSGDPATPYTGAIAISSDSTLRAKATKTGMADSDIASVTYTFGVTPGQMVSVPGGTFTMGDTRGGGYSDELPTTTVTLNSFYIGRYEVTQSEWQATMGSNPAQDYGVGDNYPVYYVSWYAIINYCNLRSMADGLTPVYSISGSTNPANWGTVPTSNNATWNAVICNWSANGYRLPTEAEWEYAARGATNAPDYLYSGSDNIDLVAWYDGNNAPLGSKPVGTKAPNGLGIYDMNGNIGEWCWDWYGSYSSSAQNNPTGPASGTARLVRGGDWGNSAEYCRVSCRGCTFPFYSYGGGFRLVRAY